MQGKNIGNLLSGAGLTWGWFQGGFDLTKTNANGTTGCGRSTVSPVINAVSPSSATIVDYVPHHEPFQYYPSTRNTKHVRPSSVARHRPRRMWPTISTICRTSTPR